MVGGTHVLKSPVARSLRVESTACDERVSARKLLKQGALPPKRLSRSMPPSKNDSAGIGSFVPGLPLSMNGQEGLMSPLFVTAHALSFTGAPVQIWPLASLLRVPLVSPPLPTHS